MACIPTVSLRNHTHPPHLIPAHPPTFPHRLFPSSLLPGSAGDDVPRPGLVLRARLEVGDGDLHRLDLLVLGGDGAEFVSHLVPFHRHVLALHAVRGVRKKGFRTCEENEKINLASFLNELSNSGY